MENKEKKSAQKIVFIVAALVALIILLGYFLLGLINHQERAVNNTYIITQMSKLRNLGESLYDFGGGAYEKFYAASQGMSPEENSTRFKEMRENIVDMNGGSFEIVFSSEDNYSNYCMYASLAEKDTLYCIDSTGSAGIIYDHGESCNYNIRCEGDKSTF